MSRSAQAPSSEPPGHASALARGDRTVIPALVALVWSCPCWRCARVQERWRRRDACVALALAGPWFAIWGLYLAYDWTTDPTEVTVQVVRFYVPAIGPISLLGAWLVTRIRGGSWATAMTSAVGHHACCSPWACRRSTPCMRRSVSPSTARCRSCRRSDFPFRGRRRSLTATQWRECRPIEGHGPIGQVECAARRPHA